MVEIHQSQGPFMESVKSQTKNSELFPRGKRESFKYNEKRNNEEKQYFRKNFMMVYRLG